MANFYPPGAFYFAVSFTGITAKVDAAFQEASGINADLETEEVVCGGENRFKFKLPMATKYGTLTLKRGFVTGNSDLAKWCSDTLGNGLNTPIAPKTITVKLLNQQGDTLVSWDFINAYPVKWGVSEFKSTESTYVVESLEFAYNYFKKG
ncbi:MAG: phage tail protein [Cyclobacteriaceae bacterium]|nr:phage tail protein [Cyclobacteriaceae bacterium]